MSIHALSTAELRQQLASQEDSAQRANFANKLQAAIRLSARADLLRTEAAAAMPDQKYEIASHLAKVISITDAPSYPIDRENQSEEPASAGTVATHLAQ